MSEVEPLYSQSCDPTFTTTIRAVIKDGGVDGLLNFFKGIHTVDKLLQCPIGRTYLLQYSKEEFNQESVLCLYEIEALFDLVCRTIDGENSSTPGVVSNQLEEVVDMCEALCDNYVGEGSKKEVNISAFVRQEVEGVLVDCIEKYNHSRSQVVQCLPKLREVMRTFKTEMVSNISDTFARFMLSDLYKEMIIVSFNLRGGDFNETQYKKAVQDFKNVNNPENAKVLNHDLAWVDGVRARHPLSVVSEVLTKSLECLREDPSIFFYNAEDDIIAYNKQNTHTCVLSFVLRQKTCELVATDMTRYLVTKEEKVAFFINLYNLMFLHGIFLTDKYMAQCVVEREMFARSTKYEIDGMTFSLDDIMNGVFGGNKKAHFLFGKPFKKDDPRKSWILNLTEEEQRDIKFSLATFVKGGPRINVVAPYTLAQQLQDAKRQYLLESVVVDTDKLIVTLPTLLKEIVTSEVKKSKFQNLFNKSKNVAKVAGIYATEEMELSEQQKSDLDKKKYKYVYSNQVYDTDISCMFTEQQAYEAMISTANKDTSETTTSKDGTRNQAMKKAMNKIQVVDSAHKTASLPKTPSTRELQELKFEKKCIIQ
ncbi:hypothetical protein AKO1_002200 [Acrasis kona]|uniref:RGS domain-containing protein n=1 Tax=Acrasis kona TaxID=1008807 RepID=A0AAW2YNT1_9EUKA